MIAKGLVKMPDIFMPQAMAINKRTQECQILAKIIESSFNVRNDGRGHRIDCDPSEKINFRISINANGAKSVQIVGNIEDGMESRLNRGIGNRCIVFFVVLFDDLKNVIKTGD